MKYSRKILGVAAVAGGLAMSAYGPASAANITLRVGSGHPVGPAVYVTLLRDVFVAEVKKQSAKTKHKVKIIEGYGGTIAKVADTLEAIQSGLLDIGTYCFCFEPAKLFLHNFPYYTPFGPQDSAQSIRVTRAVYNKVPWLTEVFEKKYKQKLIGISGWDNYHLGTKKVWNKVGDLKGVKVGGAGPNLPWLKFAGAVPVQSTLPDGYLALKTGVYDGWLMFPSAYLGFKFYEPAPVYTLIGFGSMAVNGLTVNMAKFKRLPPEIQKIILDAGKKYEAASGPALNVRQKAGLAGLKKVGAKVRTLPAEARAGWAKSLQGFAAQQAKEADKRGLPGTQVMKAYIEAVAKDGYKFPFPPKL